MANSFTIGHCFIIFFLNTKGTLACAATLLTRGRVGLCHNLWKKDWSALQINANSHGLTHLRRFITTLCHWEEEPVHATSTYLTQASVKWQFPLGVFAHFPTRQCEVERPVATTREMSEQWSRRPVINECFGLCPSFNAVQLCLEKNGYDLLQSLGVCTEKNLRNLSLVQSLAVFWSILLVDGFPPFANLIPRKRWFLPGAPSTSRFFSIREGRRTSCCRMHASCWQGWSTFHARWQGQRICGLTRLSSGLL